MERALRVFSNGNNPELTTYLLRIALYTQSVGLQPPDVEAVAFIPGILGLVRVVNLPRPTQYRHDTGTDANLDGPSSREPRGT